MMSQKIGKMEDLNVLAQLHPVAQVSVIIIIGVVACVLILSTMTDFFNRD